MAFFSGNRDSIPEPELAFSETKTTPQQRRPGRPRKRPVETPEFPAPKRARGRPRLERPESLAPKRGRGRPRRERPESLAPKRGLGRPRLERSESIAPYHLRPRGDAIQYVEDESLERERKALVDRRIEFEDDGWQEKEKDSEAKTWCEPVTRKTQVESIQSFYHAMHDDDTMELEHCVLCGLQKAAVNIRQLSWSTFYSLYEQVRDYLQAAEQEHFSC